MAEIIKAMPAHAPNVREPLIVAGGGHWLPQERPDRVNAAVVEFAQSVFSA